MATRPELADYSIHELIQEIGQRPEFWGVMVYANRPPFDRESAPDDKLLIGRREGLGRLATLRLLARAIDTLSEEAEKEGDLR